MGDVVVLTNAHRPASDREPTASESRGEIVLFTGVRIERWNDDPPPERGKPRGFRPGPLKRRKK